MITLIQHPSRARLLCRALLLSLFVHAVGYVVVRTAPLIRIIASWRGVEFVEEDFDRAILITFSNKLKYPPGYAGFRPSQRTLSLAEIRKLEERRRAREETQRRAREERERADADKRAIEEQAKTQATAKVEPTPTPAPTPAADTYPGGFGKINTSPIKVQVQRLYDAKKEGQLVIPEGKLKVGVAGAIKRDGSLADCRIITSSGIEEIDRAALAILDAVSASRAMGPLHEITSLSLILEVDQRASLTVVGFAGNEEAAANIVNLANAAVLYARIKKAGEPAAMVMLNHLKITRTGKRVMAVISMPRTTATDSLAKTMEK